MTESLPLSIPYEDMNEEQKRAERAVLEAKKEKAWKEAVSGDDEASEVHRQMQIKLAILDI